MAEESVSVIQPKTRPEWHRGLSSELVVTGREYEKVFKGLNLPKSYLSEGSMVLSIGEGLSGFAKGLNEHYPVKSVAMDPLYKEPGIFKGKPAEVEAFLEKEYGPFVKYLGQFSDDSTQVPSQDKTKMVAGSAYSLPFADKSFDLAIGYGLVEHLDWEYAIRESLRVLKSSGEVRFSAYGSVGFNMSTDHQKLFLALSQGRAPKYVGALRWLGGQKDISCYVTVQTTLIQGRDGQKKDYCRVKHMILRKDNNLPKLRRKTGFEIFKVHTDELLEAKTLEEIEDEKWNSFYYLKTTKVA